MNTPNQNAVTAAGNAPREHTEGCINNNDSRYCDCYPDHAPETWQPFTETSRSPAGVADSRGVAVAHVFGDGREQRDDRAKLIAAAPEMLEALTKIARMCASEHRYDGFKGAAAMQEIAQKAIAPIQSTLKLSGNLEWANRNEAE